MLLLPCKSSFLGFVFAHILSRSRLTAIANHVGRMHAEGGEDYVLARLAFNA